jgi:glycosyltransferase involved in cell wall biosynthesis
MKIGMILDAEYLKDARVPNEAKYLAGCGHEVYVLCLNFDRRPAEEVHERVKIVRFPLKKKLKDILFGIVNTFPVYDWIWARQIRRFISKYGIEALHAHDLYMARPAYMGNRRFNLPLTLDLHENYPHAILDYRWANQFPKKYLAQPKKWKSKEPRYLACADNIIVLSSDYRDSLCAEYPFLRKKKFAVYPNVPDLNQFAAYPVNTEIFDKGKNFILFYFGGFSIVRGMELCFDALRLLVKDIPEVKLLIIGPVPNADKSVFDAQMNDPVIKRHTVYFPWKNISELPSYASISDVCISADFINPQRDSGIANKIFQYMLFGRPAVITNSRLYTLLVEENRCGLVFKNRDASDLAKQIKWLYNHPEEREIMGQNGKKAVHEKYNLETAGKELGELYRQELSV